LIAPAGARRRAGANESPAARRRWQSDGMSDGGLMREAPASHRRRRQGLGRDFWLYFTGQVTSQLGTSFTAFALPLLVFKLTHSATNLALTMAAEFVPYLLFGLLLGAVVDRVDRKRMMIGVDLARGVVIAVLPVLYLFGELRVEYIYAVGFVQATLGILFDAGEFAAIPSLVRTDDLVAANGRIMSCNQAGQILGPVLAGALVALMATADLLFIDASTFAVSAFTLSAIRVSFNEVESGRAARPAGESAVSGLLRDVREGLSYVWRHPVLRAISIMMALINFVSVTANSQLVLFAKQVFTASDQQVGLLFAAGSAGVVVVGLSASWFRRRLSFPVVALGALVICGLSLAAMAYSPWYWLAVPLWAASTGFGLLLNINTGALRQAIVPNHMLGRIMSIAGVLAWSAIPLGALAGAAVINAAHNVRAVYAGIGVLTALIAGSFALSPIRHGERYLAAAKAAKEAAVEVADGPVLEPADVPAVLGDHALGPEESAALASELRGWASAP
jgi:MFS family permease